MYARNYRDVIARKALMTVQSVKLIVTTICANLAERDREACANADEDCFCSEGRKEGSTAFIDKRKPLLKGH